MVWGLIAVAVLIWVGRNFRPAHLGNDLLKLELFRHLRFQNAREANNGMTYEDLERSLWMRVGLASVCGFAFTLFCQLMFLGNSLTSSLTISSVISVTSLFVWLRRTREFRQTTLPLFATLCRMPQSRWDMRANPRHWVKLNHKRGQLWIRLPKDWNATAISLKFINDLVNARIDGYWKMTVNTRKFLITFSREVEAENVPVQTQDESFLSAAIITEKEVEEDGAPW